MIRIAVAGVGGRMGKRIATLCQEYEGLKFAGGFEAPGHPDIGMDAGLVIGAKETGFEVRDSAIKALEDSDILIDFTQPTATIANLKACAEKKKAIVIGTTGFSAEELNEAEALGKTAPCVMASNMSLGVNLLLGVLKDVAAALGDDYDIEVIEAHHRLKKDAPSGTALKLAQALAEGVSRNLDEVAIYERHGIIGERTSKEIGIQTIRAGDIVGEHTVIFGGLGERIEISHKASSRDTFARGALRAALWLKDKPAGLYDMRDVLGLK